MMESCKSSGASKARGMARGKFRPELAGTGETTKLTSGARMVVTEGGGSRLGKA
jgi:hypothetical protein